MNSWSDNARRRKLARQATPDDAHRPVSGKKDTRKWCGGKPGREHQPQCYRQTHYGRLSHFYSYACSKCGKELDCWFDREAAGWGMMLEAPPPDWVVR